MMANVKGNVTSNALLYSALRPFMEIPERTPVAIDEALLADVFVLVDYLLDWECSDTVDFGLIKGPHNQIWKPLLARHWLSRHAFESFGVLNRFPYLDVHDVWDSLGVALQTKLGSELVGAVGGALAEHNLYINQQILFRTIVI
ncbi:UNVERIFIED_ORG: hypothetical protein J2791_002978 [Burkholderia contaminans]|nr:hypothetical protein [Burkholderia contaminans]